MLSILGVALYTKTNIKKTLIQFIMLRFLIVPASVSPKANKISYYNANDYLYLWVGPTIIFACIHASLNKLAKKQCHNGMFAYLPFAHKF